MGPAIYRLWSAQQPSASHSWPPLVGESHRLDDPAVEQMGLPPLSRLSTHRVSRLLSDGDHRQRPSTVVLPVMIAKAEGIDLGFKSGRVGS
ncbi:hypothetical protein RHGRI_001658 [Rhododendron griersonianum]|uniref:Uncharacterized protein n=1 Tax=Rhododendron griersonianum TaxID=479676 RepID=A0AAV6LM55_9ERIC|nr:hypothetical protein RHGRI_001658 [Rhododendron griersonianum]